jgi:hypothetical protein
MVAQSASITSRSATSARPQVSLAAPYSPASEQRHNINLDGVWCASCEGTGSKGEADWCIDCGGLGAVMPRNVMAYHYISAQFPENGHLGFRLPLIPLSATAKPTWLADLIEHATDTADHALSCEQLLVVFDNLVYHAGHYETGAPYWQWACRRVIRLLSAQLVAALPEVQR